eukprot:SAG31_NODE_410_length_15989_cov_237.233984_4_plen_218_part_00
MSASAGISDDVSNMAEYMGIQLPEEKHLLWIAETALAATVPEPWQEAEDEQGNLFFHNPETGASQYEHPNDSQFDKLLETERIRHQHRVAAKTDLERQQQEIAQQRAAQQEEAEAWANRLAAKAADTREGEDCSDDTAPAFDGPLPPTKEEPGRYRVVKRAALRASIDLDSPVVGGLEVHDVITVTETRTLASGQVRLKRLEGEHAIPCRHFPLKHA